MTKKTWTYVVVGIIAVALSSAVLLFKDELPWSMAEPVAYEFLDESVLNTNEELKNWVAESTKEEGESFKVMPDATYAIVSYGETLKQGAGIMLESVTGSSKATVSYQFVELGTGEERTEPFTPKMILKFPSTVKRIEFKRTQSEPVEENESENESSHAETQKVDGAVTSDVSVNSAE